MECIQTFLLVKADGISSGSSSTSSCKQDATALTNAANQRRNRFLLHRSHVAAAHALLIFVLMPLLVAKLTVAAPVDVDVATVSPVAAIDTVTAEDAAAANVEAAAGHEASLPSNATSGENDVTQVELQPIKVNENVEELDDSIFQSLSNDQLEETIRKDVQTDIESNLEAGATINLEKSIVQEQTSTKNEASANEESDVIQNVENDQSKSRGENESLAGVDNEDVAVENKRGARNLDMTNEIPEAQAKSEPTQLTNLKNSEPHIVDLAEKSTDLELKEVDNEKTFGVGNGEEVTESANMVTNKPEEQINETTESVVPEKVIQKEVGEQVVEVPRLTEKNSSEVPDEEDVEKTVAEAERTIEETHTSHGGNSLSESETINEVDEPKEGALQTEATSLHEQEEGGVVANTETVQIDAKEGNEEPTELPIEVTKINLLSIEDEIENASAQETTVTPELKDNQHQVFKKEGVILDSSKTVEEEIRKGKALEESPVENTEAQTETIVTVELPVELEDGNDFVAKGTDEQQVNNGLAEQPQENADNNVNSYVTVQPDAAVVLLEITTTTERLNSEVSVAKDKDLSYSDEVQVETEEDTEEDQNSQQNPSQSLESIIGSSKGSRSIASLDIDAATAHKSYPPPNAGQTHHDNLADEDATLGIGKALPSSSDSGNRLATNRSAMIIAFCSIVAVMFIIISLAMFMISFRRQHGTLDIEMQEQRCGKDDLDEEDAQLKLLEVELPPQSNIGTDETDECL